MSRVRLAGLVGLLALAACGGPAALDPYPGAQWTDIDGDPVPPERLALYADDCPGRESAGFLDVLWPLAPVPGVAEEMRRYVRDPESVMPTRPLLAPYDPASSLPREARFTGFSTPDFHLWVAGDDAIYLYLVAGTRVEALPRAEHETIPCP
jgi:hypothetical protein